MLESLHLKNVGPASEMTMELAPRLNLITGDNGLGKSFLLDVAWWALTRKWPHDLNPRLTSGYPARPTENTRPATIAFQLNTGRTKPARYESSYDLRQQGWIGKAGRPLNPGLVLYSHADGGFAVWDPARNYWTKSGGIDIQERQPGYVFSPKDVWEGLRVDLEGRSTVACNGLIADWANWIRERGVAAERMQELLNRMSPSGEPIQIGPLIRLTLEDVRDIPSIHTSYAPAVPILHASSGLRRIAGLTYMLLWSWNEHVRASELLGKRPTNQVVLLFDELENHLHPKWQRTILRSLLHVAEALRTDAEIQLIAATHSPLILASAEPFFDRSIDAWFDLDLIGKDIVLQKRDFVQRGDVSNWLTSEAFDLREPRSVEAEQAIIKALEVLRNPEPSADDVASVDEGLRSTLSDIDRFWVRWSAFREQLNDQRRRPIA